MFQREPIQQATPRAVWLSRGNQARTRAAVAAEREPSEARDVGRQTSRDISSAQ